MKNITPEWEVVHMERYVAERLKGAMQATTAVYLLHKGHAVSLDDSRDKPTYLWKVVEYDKPPYAGYTCHHCDTVIPSQIMIRWIRMCEFLRSDP